MAALTAGVHKRRVPSLLHALAMMPEPRVPKRVPKAAHPTTAYKDRLLLRGERLFYTDGLERGPPLF